MKNEAQRKSRPIELLEESLQILRQAGAPILLPYWIGSAPFAAALLLLIRDAGVSWDASLLLRDSFICATAFLWMSYWKSRAARSIFLLLAPGSEVAVVWPKRAALQAIFQTLKLFVMPFAAASLLAWPAASVFFRTLALEPVSEGPIGENRPIRAAFQRAFTAATQRYIENLVAFLATAVLMVVICLNVLIALFVIPSLWKMLTGIETAWSRLQEPTVFGLFAVAALTAWLLADPWLQTYCVLRVFYQNSRSDGRDLLRDIARLANAIPICVTLVWMVLAPATGRAARVNKLETPREALERSIANVSKSGDYGWLHTRETKGEAGFAAEIAQRANAAFTPIREAIQRWFRVLNYWLRSLLRTNEAAYDKKAAAQARARELRWILGILGAIICTGIIALFLRSKQSRLRLTVESATTAAAAADVLNSRILPSEIRQDEWLRLAFEYWANNQTRLAARAFYLSNLSYLGSQNMLSLSLAKSNRLYERELARQASSSQLSAAFVTSNRLYERAWYGMRELAGDQMELLKGAADELRDHA